LQIGHEQGARHSFPGNVSQNQCQVLLAKLKKIILFTDHRLSRRFKEALACAVSLT